MRTRWRRRASITAVALTFLALGLSGAPASAQSKAQAQPTVRINEVESSGGSPGDWVELVSTGTAAVDVSKWVVKDSDDSHSYKIAKNTSIAPGAFLALDVDPSYGLGDEDSARLFAADGSLVDSYSWTNHAATTYGRCPDVTGALLPGAGGDALGGAGNQRLLVGAELAR
ncbi:lamin tail domain-containing protein [Actinacidiphila sp. ITFR-21]|uniref:lamin tail domain-containing protein n=1 Tax=Actinacidiphila sp. ITFR-21 TaxID=3075199 RepID=UPI00288C63A9|nr:lamin tail domain-containing protein [Streptomyces sp. ITFR-21]WNI18785.1 lamin tail domain-containing protein [Streptomyces sp. ITFR-21]